MWTQITVLIVLLVEGSYSDGVIYAVAPKERGAFQVGGGPGGLYHYGYNTGDGIAKVEARQADGSVVGSYRYFDPTGKQIIRSYIADKNGFRILGNDLPIAPQTPVSRLSNLPGLTGPVEGTSEFLSSNLIQAKATPHRAPQRVPSTLEKERVKVQKEYQELLRQKAKLQEEIDQLSKSYENELADRQQVISKPPEGDPGVEDVIEGDFVSDIYHAYPYQLQFDFPAGFAYFAAPMTLPPVATKTRHPVNEITAGHTRDRHGFRRPVGTYKHYQQLPRGEERVRPVYTYRPSFQYIVGHA